MKKILIVLAAALISMVSCATAKHVNQRKIQEMDEVSYVLANYYPQLHSYYMEGVLKVNSLKEIVLDDGTVDYKIRYRFVRYYYRDFNERISAVKINYPELYDLYVSGAIGINTVYKFVDKDTGRIRLHVSYCRIYDYYYRYYPGTYGGLKIYHYRPRVYPMAPRKMQPPVHPQARPNRPNNPPRKQQNAQPRVGRNDGH